MDGLELDQNLLPKILEDRPASVTKEFIRDFACYIECEHDAHTMVSDSYAKFRIIESTGTNSSVLITEFDNYCLKLFLEDGLLEKPENVLFAYIDLLEKISKECSNKKTYLDSLGQEAPNSGAKKNKHLKATMLFSTKKYLNEGISKGGAYEMVAKEVNRSPDTVRRTYERAIKRSKLATQKSSLIDNDSE